MEVDFLKAIVLNDFNRKDVLLEEGNISVVVLVHPCNVTANKIKSNETLLINRRRELTSFPNAGINVEESFHQKTEQLTQFQQPVLRRTRIDLNIQKQYLHNNYCKNSSVQLSLYTFVCKTKQFVGTYLTENCNW